MFKNILNNWTQIIANGYIIGVNLYKEILKQKNVATILSKTLKRRPSFRFFLVMTLFKKIPRSVDRL